MMTKTKTPVGQTVEESTSSERLTLHIAEDKLEALAVWARVDGRSTAAQGRHLIEQALAVRAARWTMTRR